MADSNRPQYLTLAEAAELMSVSVKTLRRRIADGTIPAYRCGRRVILSASKTSSERSAPSPPYGVRASAWHQ